MPALQASRRRILSAFDRNSWIVTSFDCDPVSMTILSAAAMRTARAAQTQSKNSSLVIKCLSSALKINDRLTKITQSRPATVSAKQICFWNIAASPDGYVISHFIPRSTQGVEQTGLCSAVQKFLGVYRCLTA